MICKKSVKWGCTMTGQNAGDDDKIGISGVTLWRLALKGLYLFEEYWILGGYHNICLICFHFYANNSEKILQYSHNCLSRI